MLGLKHIGRINSIIAILLKYGFVEIVESTNLSKLIPAKDKIPFYKSSRQDLASLDRWERIKLVVEDLGPTFVKFAQVLSNRPDVLPPELIREFQNLQDHVSSLPFENMLRIIEEETGLKKIQLFEWINEEPIGSASLGQVYEAKMRTGEHVAVKVQRPGIQETIRMDLELLREFIRVTESYFIKQGILNPLEVLETFKVTLSRELNYAVEAKNIVDFQPIAAKLKRFRVPEFYREHSTDKVLITSFLPGTKITNVDQLQDWEVDIEDVVERGFHAYLEQIFKYGIFHADPHPGNILIDKKGDINAVDFGMIGRLSHSMRSNFAGIFVGIANQDTRSIAINIYQLALENNIDDIKTLEFDISVMLEEIGTLDNQHMELSSISDQLQNLIYKHKIRLPGSIFMVLRSLIILEGMKKMLHPDLDIFKFIKPYSSVLFRELISPQNLLPSILNTSREIASLLQSLPYETQQLLTKFRKGQVHFSLEQEDLRDATEQRRKDYSRLSFAILISALIIGMAILQLGGETEILSADFLQALFFTFFLFTSVLLLYRLLKK